MAGYHTLMMMAVDDYLVSMKNDQHYTEDINRANRYNDKIERLQKIRDELDYLF